MHLNATLTKADVLHLLEQFLPFAVDLEGEKGERLLSFEELSDLSFVAERGIRLRLTGNVVWPVLGVDVPVRINALQVLLRLSHDLRPKAHLVVEVTIESADLAWVPSFVDQGITERINDAIRTRNFELAWDFESLLSRCFALPASLVAVDSLQLLVNASSFRIGEESIQLEVALAGTVRRSAVSS